MPKELLTAGKTTTILTYKSEGSVLSSYLKKLDVPVEVANDNQREEVFKKKAAELFTIKDILLCLGSRLVTKASWLACRTRITAGLLSTH